MKILLDLCLYCSETCCGVCGKIEKQSHSIICNSLMKYSVSVSVRTEKEVLALYSFF